MPRTDRRAWLLVARRVGEDARFGWTPNPMLPTGRMVVLACGPEHLATLMHRPLTRLHPGVEAEQVHQLRDAFTRDPYTTYAEVARCTGLGIAEVDQIMELWTRHLARLFLIARTIRRPRPD